MVSSGFLTLMQAPKLPSTRMMLISMDDIIKSFFIAFHLFLAK
jgi:hypothetical protein